MKEGKASLKELPFLPLKKLPFLLLYDLGGALTLVTGEAGAQYSLRRTWKRNLQLYKIKNGEFPKSIFYYRMIIILVVQ